MSAAGKLGISKEEATRRGEEAEQILRQRNDASSSSVSVGGGDASRPRSMTPSPSPVVTETTYAGTPARGRPDAKGPRDARGDEGVAPPFGRLEDREASYSDTGTVM